MSIVYATFSECAVCGSTYPSNDLFMGMHATCVWCASFLPMNKYCWHFGLWVLEVFFSCTKVSHSVHCLSTWATVNKPAEVKAMEWIHTNRYTCEHTPIHAHLSYGHTSVKLYMKLRLCLQSQSTWCKGVVMQSFFWLIITGIAKLWNCI